MEKGDELSFYEMTCGGLFEHPPVEERVCFRYSKTGWYLNSLDRRDVIVRNSRGPFLEKVQKKGVTGRPDGSASAVQLVEDCTELYFAQAHRYQLGDDTVGTQEDVSMTVSSHSKNVPSR